MDIASNRQRTEKESPALTIKCDFVDPAGFNELIMGRDGPRLYNRHDVYVGGSLMAYGEFSYSETVVFRQLVKTGNIVVEVGANIGAHTVDLARMVGPSGEVHAFEPQRLVFQALCANIALNQLTNVYTYQVGVGATQGAMQLPKVDPSQRFNYGGISLGRYEVAEDVRIVTIDSMDLIHCHFLKVDVEGMEHQVLSGAANTIATFRPVLYVENDRDDRSGQLLELIADFGYDAYWHIAPLYNPDNYAGNPHDVFGGLVSVNVLCFPKERSARVDGMPRVASSSDTWRAAATRQA